MSNLFPFTDEIVSKILRRNKNSAEWTELLNDCLPRHKIDTRDRVSAFFAQTCIESVDFSVIEENLKYSATRLQQVFPKYFKHKDVSLYANKPEAIANLVYGNRMGNGDEKSGDGYRYRGRGVIQLTGKNNYLEFASSKGMELSVVVQYLSTKKGALDSACWFWNRNNLNALADERDIDAISKRVNGGTHAINERRNKFIEVSNLLSNYKATEELVKVDKEYMVGDRGSFVVLIQRALGVPDDGIFGPTTLMAVKKFQIKNGLPVTGIIDSVTSKAILKV